MRSSVLRVFFTLLAPPPPPTDLLSTHNIRSPVCVQLGQFCLSPPPPPPSLADFGVGSPPLSHGGGNPVRVPLLPAPRGRAPSGLAYTRQTFPVPLLLPEFSKGSWCPTLRRSLTGIWGFAPSAVLRASRRAVAVIDGICYIMAQTGTRHRGGKKNKGFISQYFVIFRVARANVPFLFWFCLHQISSFFFFCFSLLRPGQGSQWRESGVWVGGSV
eukprot:Hpha_TRINITY_DN11254_c0_g1::TRINITY_DN11254_c0_g1_i1::g.167586::m.167586